MKDDRQTIDFAPRIAAAHKAADEAREYAEALKSTSLLCDAYGSDFVAGWYVDVYKHKCGHWEVLQSPIYPGETTASTKTAMTHHASGQTCSTCHKTSSSAPVATDGFIAGSPRTIAPVMLARAEANEGASFPLDDETKLYIFPLEKPGHYHIYTRHCSGFRLNEVQPENREEATRLLVQILTEGTTEQDDATKK